MSSPSAEVVAAFLGRYASELDDLADGLRLFQITIAEVGNAPGSASLVERRQALDELTQRTEALAKVAHQLAVLRVENCPPIADLVAGIGLGRLVQRLTLATSSRAPLTGEFEMF